MAHLQGSDCPLHLNVQVSDLRVHALFQAPTSCVHGLPSASLHRCTRLLESLHMHPGLTSLLSPTKRGPGQTGGPSTGLTGKQCSAM